MAATIGTFPLQTLRRPLGALARVGGFTVLARAAALAAAVLCAALAWGVDLAPPKAFGGQPTPGTAGTAGAPAGGPVAGSATLLAAGDIALCSKLAGAAATARLLAARPGVIAPLGDLAYPDGRTADFSCFDRTWGRLKYRMRPALGNHEYHTAKAAGFFAYFGKVGAVAGEPDKGYYSYDLGAWHVVVINSNCQEIGGCFAGSPQESWLRRDLAAHRGACTLAYWHHPLFSSGVKPAHALHPAVRPIWQALYEVGAALVLNGHEHNYERFAPQDPAGHADPAHGIRELVVGTGGKSFDLLGKPIANSEVRRDDTFGIVELTLAPAGYSWRFVPIDGKSFTDAGSGVCHSRPG